MRKIIEGEGCFAKALIKPRAGKNKGRGCGNAVI